mgnify:CR=1 FL=1
MLWDVAGLVQHAYDVDALRAGKVEHGVGEVVQRPEAQACRLAVVGVAGGACLWVACDVFQCGVDHIAKSLGQGKVGNVKVVRKRMLQVITCLVGQDKGRHWAAAPLAARAASMRAVQSARCSSQVRVAGPESMPSWISATKRSSAARSSSRRTRSRMYSLVLL